MYLEDGIEVGEDDQKKQFDEVRLASYLNLAASQLRLSKYNSAVKSCDKVRLVRSIQIENQIFDIFLFYI